MKKLLFLFASVLLTGVSVSATTTTSNLDNNTHVSTFVRGYGNSFIFVEQGVEFAVFPDGQFDFNVNQYGPNFSAHADFGGVSISFNTGHSYDAYVQYDDYGAVLQIENVVIYYDYYGRIVRAGNVRINYNSYGRINRVGGLYIHYNRYNNYSHYTGFINVYNRHYVYRPWHTYYAAPIIDFCIVFNRPYRQYYKAQRHAYYRPYRDNYRPSVSYSSSRRGTVAQRTTKRSNRYRQSSVGRRGNDNLTKGRRIASTDRKQIRTRDRNLNTKQRRVSSKSRANSKARVINRSDKSVKRRTTAQSRSKTVKRSDNARPRVTSKTRTQSRPRVVQKQTKRKSNTVRQRSPQRKSSQASTKRTSERLRHKSRASSNKKSNSKTSKRRN